ncbi:MAG: hypothetical protein JRN34_00355 [Nitrososphaerota archaeon]|nr:hypothetical protein [Nitrososphaerota archaeon]MDG6943143.1 hypothetical protein [Nitrososphaerota archaeon]MDG6950979.1 hypothetical protein [Nitrososphaerota archaeon]
MSPSKDGWEELCDWYDRKQREAGDLWHRALIDPGVLSSNHLAITALEEPEPTPQFIKKVQEKLGDLDGVGFQEAPLHLVIEAVRL